MKRKPQRPSFFAPIEEIHAYNAHKARKRNRAYAGAAVAGAAVVAHRTGRAVQRRRKGNGGKQRRDSKGRFA